MQTYIHTYFLTYLGGRCQRQRARCPRYFTRVNGNERVVLDTSHNCCPRYFTQLTYALHTREDTLLNSPTTYTAGVNGNEHVVLDGRRVVFQKTALRPGDHQRYPFLLARAPSLSLSLSLSLSRARALLAIPASAFSKLSRPAAFHTKFTTRLTFENVSKVP